MPVISQQFTIPMKGNTHIHNITELVQQAVAETDIQSGIVTLFIQHTTASVLIIEDEPGLRADSRTMWDRLIPADPSWQHNTRNPGEDNGHSHLRGQIQGQSLTIPFTDHTLALGTWQQIVIMDFDTRSRTRTVILQMIGE